MLTPREEAIACKAQGNVHFKAKEFEKAVESFTSAIAHDPTDHVFYSNRSACNSELGNYEQALQDAEQCIKLSPEFVKGYGRKALALHRSGRLDDAIAAYDAGLAIDGSNAQLLEGKQQCKDAMSAPNPGMGGLGSMFGPEIWNKISGNPTLSPFLADPAFVANVKSLQANPNGLGGLLGDPKIMKLFSVLMGIDMSGAGAGAFGDDAPMPSSTDADVKEPTSDPMEVEEVEIPEPVVPTIEMDAEREKALGTTCYKAKDFAQALVHYKKASEMCPDNLVYRNNIAAVLIEQGAYADAISSCDEALEVASNGNADFKLVAKLHSRKGNAYVKMGLLGEAISCYENSLLESTDRAIQKKLKQVRALKVKQDEEEYVDEDKAAEHKAIAGDHFKAGRFPEAITEFSEAIRRNPKSPALYSNRSLCYVKLMAWDKAMDDADMALKLDPAFVKAYLRKGKVQHFLKQYHKAIDTFNEGLAIDSGNSELMNALMDTKRAIATSNMSGEDDPERRQRAMQDPQVQAILQDPEMQNVLQQLQTDPAAGQKAMADPAIKKKLEVLIAAGIIQTR